MKRFNLDFKANMYQQPSQVNGNVRSPDGATDAHIYLLYRVVYTPWSIGGWSDQRTNRISMTRGPFVAGRCVNTDVECQRVTGCVGQCSKCDYQPLVHFKQ